MYRWLSILALTAGLVGVAGAQEQSDPKSWTPSEIKGTQRAPEFTEVTEWVNTKPIKWAELRGKVVVVHFFAFACINCNRNYPWYKSVAKEFDGKVVVIGVHTPELPQERDVDKLKKHLKQHEINYPVVVDNQHANWRAFNNQWWPSTYLVDKKGVGRYFWNGELAWKGARGEELMRQKIEQLLAEK
mgnify:CR=1 FL=1